MKYHETGKLLQFKIQNYSVINKIVLPSQNIVALHANSMFLIVQFRYGIFIWHTFHTEGKSTILTTMLKIKNIIDIFKCKIGKCTVIAIN
jgi:hypothetical protein